MNKDDLSVGEIVFVGNDTYEVTRIGRTLVHLTRRWGGRQLSSYSTPFRIDTQLSTDKYSASHGVRFLTRAQREEKAAQVRTSKYLSSAGIEFRTSCDLTKEDKAALAAWLGERLALRELGYPGQHEA